MKDYDSQYSNLTVPQLKQEAQRRGYKGTCKLRKPELIHLLETGELLDMSGRVEGARVFEPEEVKSISDSFQGKYATRDKAIFLIGLCIGSRVSELAQLKIADVWRGKPVSTLLIRPETAKRKKARRVPIDVNPIAQNIISEFIAWKQAKGESTEPDAPLFTSQKGGHLKRVQIHRILKRTYEEAGIEPERASTHSLRKTAATWLYEVTKDIKCVQDFLGHSDSETTEQYIDLAFRVVREGVAKFSARLEDVFEAKDAEKNDTKFQLLLHFSDDAVTISKERYFRLLEIEQQYNAQQQETRRLQELLEEVIHQFNDDPKIIYFRKHIQQRLA
ncbi:MAG: tyrosine-type recombinase/integrase [Planctomycetota bacterium]|jgi:integrase/recombinase XerD